ncbi:MAG: SpaA isopeptide-forming pilin-related protein, partial [Peptoniphilus sp.]|nr:SpaA isopeptide-forming pilin-related protein [Peptoniphilus sp.]
MKRRLITLLMAVWMIFNPLLGNLYPIFAQAIGATTVTTTIKANVTVEDAIADKSFTFELYQEGGNTPIDVVTQTGSGTISFASLSFNAPGEYNYTIKQAYGVDQDVNYDLTEKTITIRLTEADFRPVDTSADKVYYGTAPDGEFITMGNDVGGADFQVFCIDEKKTLPPNTPTPKEYKAIKDPSNDMLASMVTQNFWGNDLSTVLKKIFFFFQAHPDVYSINEQKNIVWSATGGFAMLGDNFGQYGEDIEKILKNTVLPEEYHLVVFHPVIDKIEGTERYYQDLAMGYGAAIETTPTEGGVYEATIPEFTNTYKTVEEPTDTTDPTTPGTDNSMYVSFKKADEGGKFLKDAKLKLSNGTKELNWTTEESNKTLKLEPGDYTLEETEAPSGYSIAEKIEFKLTDDGKVQIKEADGTYSEVTESIRYEAFTTEEYGGELDGHYVDNIYIRPIGGSDEEKQVGYCFNAHKAV